MHHQRMTCVAGTREKRILQRHLAAGDRFDIVDGQRLDFRFGISAREFGYAQHTATGRQLRAEGGLAHALGPGDDDAYGADDGAHAVVFGSEAASRACGVCFHAR